MRVTIIFCVLLLIVFVRGLRPILPHVTEVRVDQEKNGVGFQVGRMETLGFHGDWYLLKAVDVIAKEVTTFIETGTHSASTLHYIARTYPSMSKVYSCEPVQEWYDISKHNMETVSPADLSWKSRVKIWKDTSQNMMKDILTTEPNIVNRDALFWFDAHGQKLFEWPLREEIEFVTNNWESDAFVFIDDFKVPHDLSFGFDVVRRIYPLSLSSLSILTQQQQQQQQQLPRSMARNARSNLSKTRFQMM